MNQPHPYLKMPDKLMDIIRSLGPMACDYHIPQAGEIGGIARPAVLRDGELVAR
jgi:hypothetical protein